MNYESKVANPSVGTYLPTNNISERNRELIAKYTAAREYRELPFETQYALSLLNIMDNGTDSGDRTGVGTTRFQSETIHIDLTKEFPVLLGKMVNPRNALIEMVWIMSGRTDLAFLKEHGVNYWDAWVKEDGTFGPIYGAQMRDFFGVDQLKDVVSEIIKNPDSRRLMVSLWNPAQLKDMGLPPCHHDYQICSFIDHDGTRKLDLHIKQRSADSFVGVPYDFMLFAYYTHIISLVTDIPVNQIHLTMADYHMYKNHGDAVAEYLTNYFSDPKEKFQSSIAFYQSSDKFIKPQLVFSNELISELSDADSILDSIDLLLANIVHHDFDKVVKIINYEKENRYGFIKADVAI